MHGWVSIGKHRLAQSSVSWVIVVHKYVTSLTVRILEGFINLPKFSYFLNPIPRLLEARPFSEEILKRLRGVHLSAIRVLPRW